MKDNIHQYISLGFVAVLALMFSLVLISLLQMQSLNDSMQGVVEVTNKKTAAVNDMRDAVRMRSDSLKSMQLLSDPFERDTTHQKFINDAGKYRRAREQLVSLGMDEDESRIHGELQQLTRKAQPYSDFVAELLMSDVSADIIGNAMQEATAGQALILEKLGELVDLEHGKTLAALDMSREHYTGTRNLMFALTGIALLLSLLVARIVIRRVREKNRQLSYQASHDALTGLINRRAFEHRVERAIQHSKNQCGTHALLYIDLDQFKIVNDTCGHAAGDELLQQVSQLLLSRVRNRDTLGRLGGDEFGMLLENCPLDKAIGIANDMLDAVDAFRFTWKDETFSLGMSIGAVPLDRSTQNIASAMSAADSACYIAKESGRNQVQIAHLGDRRLQERHGEMQWASRITRALEEDRLQLWFQPIVPCANPASRDKHIEILVRLVEQDGRLVSPGCFMPAAGKYNLAPGIDRWVIGRAFEWLAAASTENAFPVIASINLSGQTIGSPEMLRYIIDKMDETGVSPDNVIFEVTETAAISNITAASSFMLTLRGCGFRFSLDDFGNGLSSFGYLKKLPVDFLKIDGSFIRDILSDPVDHAMVRTIHNLGHLLGKETVAEFVETFEVANELERIGINYAQGYAFAKPLPLSDFYQSLGPRLVVVSS